LFAKYLLRERPDAKIAVEYENDDLGRDYLKGLKQGFGAAASRLIVKEISHEISEPTIEAQIVDLKASGANVLIQFTQAKFAAQGIQATLSLKWRPLHMIASIAGSVGSTFVPAGIEASTGVMTAGWERSPADPAQADHPSVKDFKSFAAKYIPHLDFNNAAGVHGYNNGYMIGRVLERCGDDLTRKNLLHQATSLNGIVPPMFLDGIDVYNSATSYRAIHQLQLLRFDGSTLVSVGPPASLDND
jgi:branched-chain amino acid transport system substrate-binding protein